MRRFLPIVLAAILTLTGCNLPGTSGTSGSNASASPQVADLTGDWISKTVKSEGIGYWVTIHPAQDGVYTGQYYAQYQDGTLGPSGEFHLKWINNFAINVIWPDGKNTTETYNPETKELWLDSGCFTYFTDIEPSGRPDCWFVRSK